MENKVFAWFSHTKSPSRKLSSYRDANSLHYRILRSHWCIYLNVSIEAKTVIYSVPITLYPQHLQRSTKAALLECDMCTRKRRMQTSTNSALHNNFVCYPNSIKVYKRWVCNWKRLKKFKLGLKERWGRTTIIINHFGQMFFYMTAPLLHRKF